MTDWTNAPASFPNPFTALKALAQRIARRRRERQAMAALAKADDRTLRDLGITRQDIARVTKSRSPRAPNADLIFLKGPRPKR